MRTEQHRFTDKSSSRTRCGGKLQTLAWCAHCWQRSHIAHPSVFGLGTFRFRRSFFRMLVFGRAVALMSRATLGPLGSGRSTFRPPELATWPSTTPVAPWVPPAVPVASAHSLSAPAPLQVSGAAAQPPPLDMLLPTSVLVSSCSSSSGWISCGSLAWHFSHQTLLPSQAI